MSGGVDSAVTAALLTARGYDCIGVTMRLVPEHGEKSVFEPCCGLEAASDARRVCEKLGIPHRIMHAVERFDRDIIRYFVSEYTRGRTPNPCARCNRMIKFGALYRYADRLGAAYIAMGHYARLEKRGTRWSLRRAVHRPKDQSYVLAPLTQPQLKRALFPLGALTKEEVRNHARALNLPAADKAESMEICFVPDRDYAKIVEARAGASRPGPVLNTRGDVIGEHRGLIHHTLGQRRGLGIAAERPYYVVRLDPERNAVIVGHVEETGCARFTTGPLCWGGMAPAPEPFDGRVQLRSRHEGVPARVIPMGRAARIELKRVEQAVTPGQWAVCYDEAGYVLCAGIIETFEHAPLA